MSCLDEASSAACDKLTRAGVPSGTPALVIFRRGRLRKRGTQAAAPHAVVADQADRVAVVYQGIFAGDLFIDRHEDFLFADQLEEVAELDALPLNELADREGFGDFAGEVPFAVGGLKLSRQDDGHHIPTVPFSKGTKAPHPARRTIDSAGVPVDNGDLMQSLDVHNPGMPDLQFVLFVSALCTSDLQTCNVSQDLRRMIFDRCWALVHTEPPPVNPAERVLDLRGGTELTLDACVSAIRSLLAEAGISTLTWDHPVSEPTRESTPAAQPLIDRLAQLYPDGPEIVDPRSPETPA